MSKTSVGPLVLINQTMDAAAYKKIMEKHMLSFATQMMPQGWTLYQDNDPKHKSRLMMGRLVTLRSGTQARLPGWFAANDVKLINPPPYSPDINVIEHLWSFVKSQLKGKKFDSKVALWMYIQRVWSTIPHSLLQNLVHSMPDRLNEVIKAKGGPTKY